MVYISETLVMNAKQIGQFQKTKVRLLCVSSVRDKVSSIELRQ